MNKRMPSDNPCSKWDLNGTHLGPRCPVITMLYSIQTTLILWFLNYFTQCALNTQVHIYRVSSSSTRMTSKFMRWAETNSLSMCRNGIFRAVTVVGVLQTLWWTFGYYERCGISSLWMTASFSRRIMLPVEIAVYIWSGTGRDGLTEENHWTSWL